MELSLLRQIPSRIEGAQRAFTLLELLITVGIVLTLLGMTIPMYSSHQKRAKKALCMTQMRALHPCFLAYVSDKGHWPQLEDSGVEKMTEKDFYEFFKKSIEPYGATSEMWLCPSDPDVEAWKSAGHVGDIFGSYVPTAFDKASASPFRWNQPWLVERGPFHRNEGHMLMPDGSVQEKSSAFFGR